MKTAETAERVYAQLRAEGVPVTLDVVLRVLELGSRFTVSGASLRGRSIGR